MSSSIQSPIPVRPQLIPSLSTDSFNEDLASAFAQSNSAPRVPDLNIRTPKQTDWQLVIAAHGDGQSERPLGRALPSSCDFLFHRQYQPGAR
ncbi:hypothetical protein KVT40_003326 [Elsinoe batatas]|uniref:Uncharacterized protein n=1 Tax=Elsinoe batatas TaxID=2601811 RepID=A0A8K0PGY4_9PEZI|nr:hypothetical protein KVT40_003326 [Elsinoe batatas]